MIELRVNGSVHQVQSEPTRPLLEVLRDELGLRSVREGCGIGICGACTVLIDGRAISSCLTLAGQAEWKSIQTLEGLAQEGTLHAVQKAFLEHAAFQCAFCTPGFILSTVAMLKEVRAPDDLSVRHYLAGNVCRCGSYRNILEAVRAASTGPAEAAGGSP